ncbi:hypothetical protein B9N43_13945 [Denitratisoma sp. DHT3]|nr:hypothetical protein B9N43_13945 [Denitratisoma sp. DHT3]
MRRLRGRLGVAAPRVAVRTHHPWYWRAVWVVLLLGGVLILVIGAYDMGSRHAGYDRWATNEELTVLRAETAQQKAELDRLRREFGANDGNAQMARATQDRLIQQVKDLESENNHLREDLAVFESLAKERARATSIGGRR